MNTQIETLDPTQSLLSLSLDTGLYPRDVLYAAAYVFLDRAYVLLDKVGARYVVQVRGKQRLDEASLRAFAGEFENELLAQALRLRVFKSNQKIIEQVTSLAIFGAADNRPIAPQEMEAQSGDDFLDDPLGIATPWEAKKL